VTAVDVAEWAKELGTAPSDATTQWSKPPYLLLAKKLRVMS